VKRLKIKIPIDAPPSTTELLAPIEKEKRGEPARVDLLLVNARDGGFRKLKAGILLANQPLIKKTFSRDGSFFLKCWSDHTKKRKLDASQ